MDKDEKVLQDRLKDERAQLESAAKKQKGRPKRHERSGANSWRSWIDEDDDDDDGA
jgi:hypothetical protein